MPECSNRLRALISPPALGWPSLCTFMVDSVMTRLRAMTLLDAPCMRAQTESNKCSDASSTPTVAQEPSPRYTRAIVVSQGRMADMDRDQKLVFNLAGQQAFTVGEGAVAER